MHFVYGNLKDLIHILIKLFQGFDHSLSFISLIYSFSRHPQAGQLNVTDVRLRVAQ